MNAAIYILFFQCFIFKAESSYELAFLQRTEEKKDSLTLSPHGSKYSFPISQPLIPILLVNWEMYFKETMFWSHCKLGFIFKNYVEWTADFYPLGYSAEKSVTHLIYGTEICLPSHNKCSCNREIIL